MNSSEVYKMVLVPSIRNEFAFNGPVKISNCIIKTSFLLWKRIAQIVTIRFLPGRVKQIEAPRGAKKRTVVEIRVTVVTTMTMLDAAADEFKCRKSSFSLNIVTLLATTKLRR